MATTYTCPNCDDIDESAPGKCPKCNATLQAVHENEKEKDIEIEEEIEK